MELLKPKYIGPFFGFLGVIAVALIGLFETPDVDMRGSTNSAAIVGSPNARIVQNTNIVSELDLELKVSPSMFSDSGVTLKKMYNVEFRFHDGQKAYVDSLEVLGTTIAKTNDDCSLIQIPREVREKHFPDEELCWIVQVSCDGLGTEVLHGPKARRAVEGCYVL